MTQEPPPDTPTEDAALLSLLLALKARGYCFVTPTPASHARVLARQPGRPGTDLRDALGWSLPFDRASLPAGIVALLEDGGALETLPDGRMKSRCRVSTVGEDLFLHSAYPTTDEDAVFFGPDSYRFADLIRRELTDAPPAGGARLVDIGAGAGVGAIAAARVRPDFRIAMTDINAKALRLARINAQAASVYAEILEGEGMDPVDGEIDIALANPPYIVDDAGREYRDGGGMHGGEVALEMATQAVARLSPEGRLILYTGSAIVAGADRLHQALEELARSSACDLRYGELDPDVFGEELAKPAYRDVERIALVAAVMVRKRS